MKVERYLAHDGVRTGLLVTQAGMEITVRDGMHVTRLEWSREETDQLRLTLNGILDPADKLLPVLNRAPFMGDGRVP